MRSNAGRKCSGGSDSDAPNWVLGAPQAYEQGRREGLLKLGYVESQSITIDWRRSIGSAEELHALVTDLLKSKPDLIVAFGTPAARAASQLATVPIVFLSSDPVAAGLVASLARPGGNATGTSSTGVELTAKRLELLRQFVPRARRIGCLVNTSSPAGALQLEQARHAARTLNVELVKFNAHDEAELDAALRSIPRSTLDAMLVTGDNLFLDAKIRGVFRRARLPTMSPTKDFLGEGVLVSYGPSMREERRMAAGYVGKILKGAKPGDLPVEEISKFELIIDLRVADEMKIKVPQELLFRADEVIR